eukprot:1224834-Pleurochrysis_carterae.AAC.1
MTFVYRIFRPARRRRSRRAKESDKLKVHNLAHRGEQWPHLFGERRLRSRRRQDVIGRQDA